MLKLFQLPSVHQRQRENPVHLRRLLIEQEHRPVAVVVFHAHPRPESDVAEPADLPGGPRLQGDAPLGDVQFRPETGGGERPRRGDRETERRALPRAAQEVQDVQEQRVRARLERDPGHPRSLHEQTDHLRFVQEFRSLETVRLVLLILA
jgi:hypothetical protein